MTEGCHVSPLSFCYGDLKEANLTNVVPQCVDYSMSNKCHALTQSLEGTREFVWDDILLASLLKKMVIGKIQNTHFVLRSLHSVSSLDSSEFYTLYFKKTQNI